MKKILKQILITLTVVVFTGCGTGDEGSSSGGNGKLIKIKDLLPEAAKNVLLKTKRGTESDGSFSEGEFFYDDESMKTRATYSINGSLISETIFEGGIDESRITHRNINPEYETGSITKNKYKNKRLVSSTSTNKDVVGITENDTRYKTKVVKLKVLKRKGSMITEYVSKHYNDDNDLLVTYEHKFEADKLKITRHDITTTYSKHAKNAAGETHKSYTTYEYDDTLNTIKPHAYGAEENAYINNAISGIYIPSKITSYYDNQRRAVITNTFEFDNNGLMTKRIENGQVITYTYIDKN